MTLISPVQPPLPPPLKMTMIFVPRLPLAPRPLRLVLLPPPAQPPHLMSMSTTVRASKRMACSLSACDILQVTMASAQP